MENPTSGLCLKSSKISVCTDCACLCDDLKWSSELGWIDQFRCHRINNHSTDSRLPAQIVETAVEKLISQLQDAIKYNYIIALTGLETIGFEMQKMAFQLAESLNAWVLPHTASTSADPWELMFSQLGGWHATWSEVRLRSDGILFWYAPIWQSHPRWIERFGPLSHHAHRLAVVEPDTPLEENHWMEEQFVRLEPGHAIAFLAELRVLLQKDLEDHHDSKMRRILHQFRNSQSLAVVRSADPRDVPDKASYASQLNRLVMENNSSTRRIITSCIPEVINASGFNSILSWRAGLPLPVCFSQEGPVFRPDEISIDEFDLIIAFGNHPVSSEGKKSIWLKPGGNEIRLDEDFIELPVSKIGYDAGGTIIRADGIAIHIEKKMETGRTDVGQLIEIILDRIDTMWRHRRTGS